jgi:hypothetical protein
LMKLTSGRVSTRCVPPMSASSTFRRAPAPTDVAVHRMGNPAPPARHRARRLATGREAYRTLHRQPKKSPERPK